MSDTPPPGVAAGAAGPAPSALTREAIDAVLADFRDWLTAAAAPLTPDPSPPGGEGRNLDSPLPPAERGRGEGAGPAVDLHTLLAQFTALRHEVNLQTRAVRAQQEQNAETLRQLTQALDALAAAQDAKRQAGDAAADELTRPLLKTLVDLYDALALAGREIRRVQDAVLPTLEQVTAEADEPPPSAPRPPAWLRWLGRRAPDAADHAAGKSRREERARQAREAVEGVRRALAALLDGYTMSLQRIDRALAQNGLEPLAAVGRPFDPELMEAVEAVAGSGRPPGEVLGEVRRGYRRNGRVFRCAQVRVARS
jgi:molecular chaperone GrpE